ncbi:MAG: LodA/GoxA family CTQ-dependent oxidase [Candidatus Sulfotelmatobacter sp.]
MSTTYRIHPKLGIARVGNSPTGFYVGPEKTGGLPMECDSGGNVRVQNGQVQYQRTFKDEAGAILRQAARFKIFRHDESGATEVALGDDGIRAIRWTVHVANKKPIWFTFSDLLGNLEFGESNSYQAQHVALNNADETDPEKRRKLMIDPGPRSVAKPGDRQLISRYNIPAGYKQGSFPPATIHPAIDSLGEIIMDADGRLLVIGGFGTSAGLTSITAFQGASGWWDDISDGVVMAALEMESGNTVDLEPAWVLVASPKYAPELVNIITLDDTMFDIAIRFLKADPRIYDSSKHLDNANSDRYDPFAGFNPDYEANYQRDIEPIIVRLGAYRWVAHVPSMLEFGRPAFATSDPSLSNRANRERYFSFFRVPVPPESHKFIDQVANGPNCLFSADGVPLLPLNSGDNSVTSALIYKFLTLTPTQYFLLHQWSIGKFTSEPPPEITGDVIALDREVIGNCVGGPFSPGIETTWIVRSPKLYSKPFSIQVAHWQGSNQSLCAHYADNGLSLTSDPQQGDGSEPGDLTKRMAIPWQSDLYVCTAETPNVTHPAVNQNHGGIQAPPTYYVYWWPPQSPMHVVAGDLDPGNQVLDAYVSNAPAIFNASNGLSLNTQSQPQQGFTPTAAGQSVTFLRGVNSFAQMVASWPDLGFIVNKGTKDYPYFVETERNTTLLAQGTALGTK